MMSATRPMLSAASVRQFKASLAAFRAQEYLTAPISTHRFSTNRFHAFPFHSSSLLNLSEHMVCIHPRFPTENTKINRNQVKDRQFRSSAVSSSEIVLLEKGADTAKRRPKKEASSASGGGGVVSSGPWLLVGLGNPGTKYAGTRHNVGFELLDELAASEGISISETKNKALIGKGRIAGTQVVLVKPQTYMNLSGDAVGPLARFFKIPIERVLVVYDDLDTETADLRLKLKGGHGGHNGMRSIIQHFSGSQAFPRLRVGIGRPPGKMPVDRYVLTPFTAREKEDIAVAMSRGAKAVRAVLSDGIERAVSQWNGARVKA